MQKQKQTNLHKTYIDLCFIILQSMISMIFFFYTIIIIMYSVNTNFSFKFFMPVNVIEIYIKVNKGLLFLRLV
jgi:hypothetical protein